MATQRSRLAGPHESELLAALHDRCFGDAGGEVWNPATIAALQRTLGVFAYLAVIDDETPVGLLIARTGGGESEILTMGILPEHRRQGGGLILINAALVHAAEDGADAMFLEVADDNRAAQTLYRRGGFHPVGRRAGYYERPGGRVDAILMRRDIVAPAESGRPESEQG